MDIAVASFPEDVVRCYQNDPTGLVCGAAFCAATLASADGANELAIADFDRDGDLDLALTSRSRDRVIWLENAAGDASAWNAEIITESLLSARELAVADLDGDGDMDILAEAGELDLVVGFAWFVNDLDGRNSCPDSWCLQILDIGFSEGLAIADLDRDGDPDLLRSEDGGGGLAWWDNTGAAGTPFTENSITTSTPSTGAITPVDLDADGDLDVLLGAGLWMENTAGDASSWTERSLPTPEDGFRFTVGDFDGDGDTDLAGAGSGDDSVGFFFNLTLHRTATFEAARAALSGAADADSVTAVDLDLDGDLDLVTAAGDPDAVTFLENDGTPEDGGWIERTVATGGNPFSVAPGDFDGDGDLDLMACLLNDDTITWFENDGDPASGTWTAYDITTSFIEPIDCQPADLDGDGDLDVLASSREDDLFSWFENNGSPTTVPWTRRDIGTEFDRPLDATAADLDGDGDLDGVATAWNDDTVAWWENDGTPQDGGWTRWDIDTSLIEAAGHRGGSRPRR